jgi:hypothetical protein
MSSEIDHCFLSPQARRRLAAPDGTYGQNRLRETRFRMGGTLGFWLACAWQRSLRRVVGK